MRLRAAGSGACGLGTAARMASPASKVGPASAHAGPAARAYGLPAVSRGGEQAAPARPQPCWQLQDARQPMQLLPCPQLTPDCLIGARPVPGQACWGPRSHGRLCAASDAKISPSPGAPGAHLVPASVGSRPSASTSTAPDPAGGPLVLIPKSYLGGKNAARCQHRRALR